ncbi:hypothetical protein CAEBREN_30548 [Caenorhabditis brenneri]|uniref:Uncharacterized protein n=1 Tax=Caenorhabditis brenneri TaxID=135651 RepID=G0NBG0_CAEBE|nr:hypothetical protein CAEBREN_30548 [Caenorhabditis brenneri]
MGNNSSNTPNFHYFANIENPNRSLQQPLMDVINIISTCVNFILFYLILFDPRRRESRTYRMILFVQTFSLWLSQLHWGSLHGLVFLFPFPGLYGIGYLTPYLSSYIIWLFMFAVTVLTMFLILIVRLKAIARQNSFFNFPSFIYIGFTILLTFYILVPMPFCWITSGSTTSESQNFVKEFYPNASKVLTIPGVFIYTDPWKFHRILIVAIGLLVTGGMQYVVLCQVILYEIHQQCKVWSEKVLKYHRKALKDSVIQVVILGIFLGATPFLQILNAYRDPEVDTISQRTKQLPNFSPARIL